MRGAGAVASGVAALMWVATGQAQAPSADQQLIKQYCAGCHNDRAKTGGLSLEKFDVSHPSQDAETWEKVIRKVRAGMMPPGGMPRPDRASMDAFAGRIEAAIDHGAKPNPGTSGLHRLNRAEYANAVRDLLALDVDAATLPPADDSSEGFDNIADALAVSPALVERYVAAASKIARLAVGNVLISPSTVTYRVPADLSQNDHLDGQPLGTRGGLLVHHTFPLDAEYAIKVRSRGAGIGVGGAGASGEELEITLNGARVKIGGLSQDLQIPVKAGPQTIGAAFVRKSPPGADDVWQTFAGFSSLQSIAITGPLKATGPGDTPSRRKIFVCTPSGESDEATCAKKILTSLALHAYRQPPSAADLDVLQGFYQNGRKSGSFDAGIEQAIARVLVDPRFVFRFEKAPSGVAAGAVYRVPDLELASRLSFFLWSSVPDDELLNVAIAGKLHEPAVLEQQTRRMLKDAKADALVTNFGGQWLYLRELKSARPETRGFNDNLRQDFRTETEMLLGSILHEDRNVLDLLTADYTFVDEALAKHYGIPNVHGSRFRRVHLDDDARRGLLGQSSFLLVTSVATRTSPVGRGKWVLENLLGTPPPLPPPNVPPLNEDEGSAAPTSVRDRMEQHRKEPVCAACHKIMDPIGFSLENFDLIGRWRTTDGGMKIDTTSQMVEGTKVDGPVSLRNAILARSDVFVQTMTEKLLTYGSGRALKYYDVPVVRSIVRDARKDDYKFSALILGIVKSEPFLARTNASGDKK